MIAFNVQSKISSLERKGKLDNRFRLIHYFINNYLIQRIKIK